MKKSIKKNSNISKPYQEMYDEMENKLNKSFEKLSKNMKKNAPLNEIKKNTQELFLLLGEVNFLTKECKTLNKRK